MSTQLIHYGFVTTRVTGTGILKLFLHSLDDVRNVQLPSIIMSSPTQKEEQVLANFVEQGAQLEIRTEALDETFNISKIVIFVKPVFSERPR